MTLLVDTSVWSLAFRRDRKSTVPQVSALRNALEGDDMVVTTGLVLQELLQGFAGPRAQGPDRAICRLAARQSRP
jgi:predicted nucleic acid-binding protein